MRIFQPLCCLVAIGLSASILAAQEAETPPAAETAKPPEKPADKPTGKPAAKPKSDLDDDVLKLLADETQVDLAPPKAPHKQPDGKQPEGKAPPAIPGLDDKLIRELETDIAPDDANPLVRLGERMRSSQAKIAQAQSGAPTQDLQNQIVQDLEQILKSLEQQQKQKQPQGGKSQPQSPQDSQRQQASKPKSQPGDGQGKRDENDKAARDSTKEAGPDRPPQAAAVRAADLLNDRTIWGHLPEHERQVLIQAAKLQFLGEYRQLIEDYYTRLANPQKEP